MRDNRPLERQAETLIEHHLLKGKFKTAKPSFDIDGADLIILDEISQKKDVKFLKVQSKLRTLSKTSNSHVSIPINYVTNNFILFLVISTDGNDDRLFVFFEEDIKNWSIKSEEYVLSLSESLLTRYSNNLFSEYTVTLIKDRLMSQGVKNYTSIIIDGVFLEKAIRDTKTDYSKIWPQKEFKKPTLIEVVQDLLRYNTFKMQSQEISCILFLSKHHNLENFIDFPKDAGINLDDKGIIFTIRKTEQIVYPQVLDQLNRTINVENIILVADDIVYENELNNLKSKGIEINIIKQSTDEGSRMFTKHNWGKIAYALGRSIGLDSHEL